MTDIVIAWVDGDDPIHKKKKQQFLTQKNETSFDDIAGELRFKALGELTYCISSILRFAKWAHAIYIVTDNQDPHLEEFLTKNFPDNQIPIKLIDHSVLFRGYEQYLPTFNSLAICTMLWRIPGLADQYLYFNDDVFLAKELGEDTWFKDGKTICYATKFYASFARILRFIKPKHHGHKPFGHKDPMLNSADILKSPYFWLFPHAPVPLKRSWFEKFFKEHEDLLVHNIKFRFREPSQFSAPNLFYISSYRKGECVIRSSKNTTVFFKPDKKKGEYMKRKIAEAENNPNLKFGCINSLSKTTEQEREIFKEWISKRLDIKI